METHVGKMRLIGQKLEHTEFQKKKKKWDELVKQFKSFPKKVMESPS